MAWGNIGVMPKLKPSANNRNTTSANGKPRPPSRPKAKDVVVPLHRKRVIKLLSGYMARCETDVTKLSRVLKVDRRNLIYFLSGERPIPLAWLGFGKRVVNGEVGRNRPESHHRIDLAKALGLKDDERTLFVEWALATHGPQELSDLLDKYRADVKKLKDK